jgi:arylsulfatase A-like enzyme
MNPRVFRLFGVAVLTLLLSLTLGAALAVGRLEEVREHSYPERGLWRNAFIVGQADLLEGLRAAAPFGVAAGGVALALLLGAWSLSRSSTQPAKSETSSLSIYLASMATVIFVTLVAPTRDDVSSLRWLFFVAVVAALALTPPIVRALGLERDVCFPIAGIGLLGAATLSGDFLLSKLALGPLVLAATVCVTSVLGLRSVLGADTQRRRRIAGTALLIGPLLLFLVAAPALSRLYQLHPGSLEVRRPWNVVLVGIDTLRFDRVLGPASPTGRLVAPRLRSLAQESVVFENASSQAPWTLPSFASIMTGRYPRQHGATAYDTALPKLQTTLAEVLREAGYRTLGVVSHVFVDSEHGFSQGFDFFDDSSSVGHDGMESEQVTDLATASIEAAGSSPFFLFVHYFDPHYEYLDREEWDWADGYEGWLRTEPPTIKTLEQEASRLEEADLLYVKDLYDEEVAATDRELGRLLDYLDTSGLSGETLLVLVADHGEEFREHGSFAHSETLYQELIHVPLMVRVPEEAGVGGRRRVTVPVETRAVFGTILTLLGLEGWRGEGDALRSLPLEPTDSERFAEQNHPVFFEVLPQTDDAPSARLSAVRRGSWKLVLDHRRGEDNLFDLSADPLEREDLSDERPERAREMRALLSRWLARMDREGGPVDRTEVDDDLRKKLNALGYF